MEFESVSQIERATLAAIPEASGGLVAGGEVVSTIKKGIIDPAFLYFTIRGMMLP